MKIYTMHSNSHAFLYEEIFKHSLIMHEPDVELASYDYPQICLSGNYYDIGWKEMMEKKIDIYIEAVSSDDDFFIWSDVDIEFYAPFIDQCVLELDDSDIAFQKGIGPNGEDEYCAGFFICKINSRTKEFFHKIKHIYNQYPCDQEVINLNIKDINASFLSDKFFNVSKQYRNWQDEHIDNPRDIIMCHANYTVGVVNKIKLLRKIKNNIEMLNSSKIKFLSAEYGVFNDVTDLIVNTLSESNITKIDTANLNIENLPLLNSHLYIFDDNYDLIDNPIPDQSYIMMKND